MNQSNQCSQWFYIPLPLLPMTTSTNVTRNTREG